jgi:hypothetical protein
MIDYSLHESSRAKHPSIKYRNGRFTVTIPEGSNIDPEKVIERNIEWVRERQSDAEEFREKLPERRFEPGAKWSVLGQRKPIVVEKRRSNRVSDSIFLAEHLVKQTGFRDQLEKVLREYARNVFESKADKHAESISKEHDRIFIRDQQTRWGSCSSKGNLNFNWRLVLGPERVLEYVVVHELVHLEHPNHGEKFWKRVEELMPDYREHNEWLSKNSAKLVFDPDDL